MSLLLKSVIYFSYSQFFVYDAAVEGEVGPAWTEAHTRQGFARRASTVSFGTLAEFGEAELKVYGGCISDAKQYTRAIEVPLYVPTGRVSIDGTDELPIDRHVMLEPGHYSLVAAQQIVYKARHEYEDNVIAIDLFFQKREVPLSSSRILIADETMPPTGILLETAEVA